MKFFKTRPVRETPGGRFRPEVDVFAMRRDGDVCVAEVRASPERAVELFHELSEEMPAVVDFAVRCVRSGREYVGEGLQLSEVTDTIARLKVPLATSGGVELSVYSGDEQLGLSPMLDLWIYARSDRWLYLLLGRGLEERASLPARAWVVEDREFVGASELVDAVKSTAQRLTLKLVPGSA